MNEIAILLLAVGLIVAFVQGYERSRRPDRTEERRDLHRMVEKRRRG